MCIWRCKSVRVDDIEAVLICGRAVIDWWEWTKVKVLWGMSVS